MKVNHNRRHFPRCGFVSVPLRGFRHESAQARAKHMLVELLYEVSVPLRGFRHESMTAKKTLSRAVGSFRPLAGF